MYASSLFLSQLLNLISNPSQKTGRYVRGDVIFWGITDDIVKETVNLHLLISSCLSIVLVRARNTSRRIQ